MTSIIKIKRSSGTAAPSTLEAGELAYSFGSGLQNNGGDRLYFGTGSNVQVIGGKYFTDLLDHAAGTLTASSALIVDSNSKVNNFKVDNLDFDGNTISTTDTNGDLILAPNGTGSVLIDDIEIVGGTIGTTNTNGDLTLSPNGTGRVVIDNLAISGNTIVSTDTDGNIFLSPDGAGTVDVSASKITNLLDPENNLDAVNLQYLNQALDDLGTSSFMNIAGDDSTTAQITFSSETLTFTNGVNEGAKITVAQGTGLDSSKVFVTLELAQDLSTAGNPEFASVTGGDLTLSLNTLSSGTTNSDINITPNGTGSTVIKNLEIQGLTSGSVLFVGSDGTITQDAGITYNATTDTLTVASKVAVDDIEITGSTISTLSNLDLNLTPNGTGVVVASKLEVTDLTAGRVVYVGTDGRLVDSSNLTYNGTTLDVTGDLEVDNIKIDGNTISSTNTNGNINLTPNGTGSVAINSDLTVTNDVTITGDLIVNGTTTTINTVSVEVEDPLLKLALNNSADSVAIGFYGGYNNGTSNLVAGLFRDHVSKEFYLFKDFSPDPTANTISTVGISLATINAVIDGGTY